MPVAGRGWNLRRATPLMSAPPSLAAAWARRTKVPSRDASWSVGRRNWSTSAWPNRSLPGYWTLFLG
jgi:hypothetical protein